MKRSTLVVLVLSLCAVAAGAWFLLRPRHKLPEDPLAAVPADAYGVVRIRVDRVLASEAWKRLIVEQGQARGIERVTKACGFNPLERIRELVVMARPAPGGGLPHFAFTARGELHHEELVDCVRKVTGADSAKLKREDIEDIPCVVSSKGSSRACFVGRDGIVGGDSDSVQAAIFSMVGKAPNVTADPVIKDLFHEVDQGTDIALVARLPDELRSLTRSLADGFLGGQLVVLADVRALSGNVNLGEGKIAGGGLLVTTDSARASAIVALLKGTIDRFLSVPGIGLTPAGGVLRSIQAEASGDRATITGSIKVSTVEALLELLPALDQLRGLLEPTEPTANAATPDAGVPSEPTPEPAPAPAKPEPKRVRKKAP